QEGLLTKEELVNASRMMVVSAKMTAGEVATGRRRAGNVLLSKEAKQESRKSLDDLTEACMLHLPALLGKFQSDSVQLSLLLELPVQLPKDKVSLWVSGSGKASFSSLLRRLRDVFLMSGNEEVVDKASASLHTLLSNDHARKAEVESTIQKTMQDLVDKALSLL
ncbi:unnamed protein product, partial [Discosporangium mesarthrocarpum]